jgi:hypothetical protein
MAFVGLSMHGRANVSADDVRDALMRQEAIRQSLVHLIQIRQGRPFHFLLKLCCLNMQELDEATNAIGFTRLGNVRFESATLVVASGMDLLPMLRRADLANLSPGPDLTPMVYAGERVFSRLPVDQQKVFNLLDASQQLAAVKSLTEIGNRIDLVKLNTSTRDRLESAVSTFSRECIVHAQAPNLTGAVSEVTAAVEDALKRLLARLTHAAYGQDLARIQRELRLPTRDIRNLSLRRVVQALRTACEHDDFVEWAGLFDDSWMERIERFTDARSRRHDAVAADVDGTQLIDEMHHTIIEAIEISSWVESRLAALDRGLPPTTFGNDSDEAALDVAPSPRGRELGVFISYASSDREIAGRIAMGLTAFGYRNFYDVWEMQPGESILARINLALAESDILLVLLSAQSVASRWVRHELDTALMGQLRGRSIQVIPVVIGDCEIPEMLQDMLQIDMRPDFEEGLRTLLDALRRRRRM